MENEEIDINNLYCKKCKKKFKNLGTFENHIKSAQHLKKKHIINKIQKKETKHVLPNDKVIIEYKEDINDNKEIINALANLIEKKMNKKQERFNRINKHKNLKINNNRLFCIDISDKNIKENKSLKINKARDKIQKNVLVGSRSSWVKSGGAATGGAKP
jgi:c-di-GMP-related signal transduction protein